MRLYALLGLILCNLIWSVHPVMGKLVLADFSPVHGAWLRYFLALLSYGFVILVYRARVRPSAPSSRKSRVFSSYFSKPFFKPSSAKDLGIATLLGFFTFCYSGVLQFVGLNDSRATDNSLIIAIEPLVLVFLAWLILRERVSAMHGVSFALSILGFCLLTGLTPSRLQSGLDSHLIGNLVLLVSLVGEGMFSVLGLKLIGRYPASAVFGTSLLVGVALLTVATFVYAGPPPLEAITLKSAFGLFWLGCLGTMGAYLFWMILLVDAPVASLAITLFIQPVAGALWGILFLDERLNGMQALGGCLILAAVYLSTRFKAARRST